MTVISSAGSHLGQIAQDNIGVFRKVRFRLESNGQSIGSIHAENYSAWDFRIDDANGIEVARVTKEWAGFLKERFTRADNYVVQIHRPLQDPLRSLVVAAATAVDVALKQGDPGPRRYR